MKAVLRNIIELDDTSFCQLLRESSKWECNWFLQIFESDHILCLSTPKAGLSDELNVVLTRYYSADKQVEFAGSANETSSQLPALYRIVGNGGFFSCFLDGSQEPLLNDVPLKTAMEQFLLMPKKQSRSYNPDKITWKSEELGPLNLHDRVVIFDDYAMANADSFESFTHSFLSELIRVGNLKFLELFIFFSRGPKSEFDDLSEMEVINRCVAHLKTLPVEIDVTWFQLHYHAKASLPGTHQRFICTSSFELVRDGGFNNKVNSKNLRVNRHFCHASQIESSASFMRRLNDELKKLQPRQSNSFFYRHGGDVKRGLQFSLPLVPYLIRHEGE